MKPIFADFQTDVRHTCYLNTIRMSNSQKQNDSSSKRITYAYFADVIECQKKPITFLKFTFS